MKNKYRKYRILIPDINYFRFFIILVISIFSYFFISNCIIKYIILTRKCKILEVNLKKLKQENEKLLNQLNLIKNDPDTIEYYIRKELKYKKPEEKIIILK